MELPNDLVLLISAGIGFLVTNGLKALFPNLDISGVAAKVTAAVVTSVVALASWGLTFVPEQYRQVVSSIFTLIIVVLSAFGIHYSLKAQARG
jgi:hypothetical protein